MTPHDFIRKWQAAQLTERSACQQHFLDLCELLGQPKPAEVDPRGLWYTFEKGVQTVEGGKGWADVWMQGKFGWEYKGKHKDLKIAYQQLLKYRESLENPPLLVVCDLDRFEIHTNFTGTVKKVHAFDLDGLADPRNVLLLRNVFTNPETLRPGKTQHAITEEVAGRFARLADALGHRGIAPQQAAHFLMQLMFCMFAQGIDLLPHELFTRTLAGGKSNPILLSKLLAGLFRSMATGEPFGADAILRFNGGLFADTNVIDLLPAEIDEIHEAALCDWSSVEPTIFGTLFERSLDPTKRSQIGAHYTSRADIETILKPVLLAPLQREWDETKQRAEKAWGKVQSEASKGKKRRTDSPARRQFNKLLEDFMDRLRHVTVLDPACGSGNFLYVAIHLLLDLEKEVLNYAGEHDLPIIPLVRPTQLFGQEINPYAQQLAQVVLWIGYLQWKFFNGYQAPLDPVLDPFENIRHADAILDLSDPAHPAEPDWPDAEFIVGNPPFLGTKKLRTELGDDYVEKLFKVYGERIPNFSDLCCYWFEKARSAIEQGHTKRVGLIATQGIRGGLNRRVLERIKETGDIFLAWSDRDWILDGANVHISIVGFDAGREKDRWLDGNSVSSVNANLTATADVTQAKRLLKNRAVGFIADVKAGKFDIASEEALLLLQEPNPHGRPNSDVLRPWIMGWMLLGGRAEYGSLISGPRCRWNKRACMKNRLRSSKRESSLSATR
ncbi:MAG TPA: DNA methyltransferase [Gemmataceae bacterium]|nr:DNA methyltransferase [Gemmataceae bacterium]